MSIVNRAINMITKPKEEWEVIAAEPSSVAGLFTGYAMILALLPAIGTIVFLGLLGMGAGAMGGGAALGLGMSFFAITAVVGYVVGLGLFWLVSLIVNAITPSFNGKQDMVQATKLMVYAATPTWLAGITSGIPLVGILLSLAAMGYAVYLIYLGVRPVLSVPEDKVAGMTVVTVLIYIVTSVVIGGIIAVAIMGMFFSGAMMGGAMSAA
jgi:Yip1 domain